MTASETKPSEWVKLTVIIPGALWPAWEAAKDKAARAGISHRVQNVENGLVLEVLIAEFLASPDPPPGFEG